MSEPSEERSGGKKLDEDDELLIFFSGAVRCEGNCSSGLMLSSLRATLQQSFQLLLDARREYVERTAGFLGLLH